MTKGRCPITLCGMIANIHNEKLSLNSDLIFRIHMGAHDCHEDLHHVDVIIKDLKPYCGLHGTGNACGTRHKCKQNNHKHKLLIIKNK